MEINEIKSTKIQNFTTAFGLYIFVIVKGIGFVLLNKKIWKLTI
jgi:hypothetical protein